MNQRFFVPRHGRLLVCWAYLCGMLQLSTSFLLPVNPWVSQQPQPRRSESSTSPSTRATVPPPITTTSTKTKTTSQVATRLVPSHGTSRFNTHTALYSTSPPNSSNNNNNNNTKNKTTTPNQKKSSSGRVNDRLRNKLVAETIAPWRAVRLFLYGALGSGAALGGFVTLTGTLAALSGARTDLDLSTEYVNLAIDFGAVAIFAILAKIDLDKQGELDQRVEEKVEKKKQQRQVAEGMKEREQQLGALRVKLQLSPDGQLTKEALVRELQTGARQHVIIVAGPKKACRDALVGANLLKMDFAMSNVLVVPYEMDVNVADLLARPDGTGFGDSSSATLPIYERQAYVARPTGEGWEDYIRAEMEDAVKQNGKQARDEGIAIVVARNGKVIRRGVGKVPWRQMVEQLEESVKA